MLVSKITYPDLNNGLGNRVTLWLVGCNIKCEGCHNKAYWTPSNSTKKYTAEEIFNILKPILEKPYIKGLTISGGELFYDINRVYANLKDAKDLFMLIKTNFPDKDIWVYTGKEFTFVNSFSELISNIDYLVVGPYKRNCKDLSLAFRGSSNQDIYKKEGSSFKLISKKIDKNEN